MPPRRRISPSTPEPISSDSDSPTPPPHASNNVNRSHHTSQPSTSKNQIKAGATKRAPAEVIELSDSEDADDEADIVSGRISTSTSSGRVDNSTSLKEADTGSEQVAQRLQDHFDQELEMGIDSTQPSEEAKQLARELESQFVSGKGKGKASNVVDPKVLSNSILSQLNHKSQDAASMDVEAAKSTDRTIPNKVISTIDLSSLSLLPSSLLFSDFHFVIIGPHQGVQRWQLQDLLELHGATVGDLITEPGVTHVLFSEYLWPSDHQQHSNGIILWLVDHNADLSLEDQISIVPHQWVSASLVKGHLEPEQEYDLEVRRNERLENSDNAAKKSSNGGSCSYELVVLKPKSQTGVPKKRKRQKKSARNIQKKAVANPDSSSVHSSSSESDKPAKTKRSKPSRSKPPPVKIVLSASSDPESAPERTANASKTKKSEFLATATLSSGPTTSRSNDKPQQQVTYSSSDIEVIETPVSKSKKKKSGSK